MPRMYEPSWLELKKSKTSPKQIRIAAPAKYHPRIYKAIIKEKDMDVVYKLQLSELSKRAYLRKRSEAGVLTIEMTFTIGTDDF